GVGIEDDRELTGRHGLRTELPERAARSFFADRLRVVELVEEALRGPVVPATLLAALVFGDRHDAQRLVRAFVSRTESARQDDRRAACRSAEGRAFAVRDPGVEIARGLLADLRGRDRLRGIDAAPLRIEQIELG